MIQFQRTNPVTENSDRGQDTGESTHGSEREVRHSRAAGKEWSEAVVRLLQGVIYADESTKLWEVLIRNQSVVRDYLDSIGLMLVIDEGEAMAYLRQADEEEADIPRLFRKYPLSYEATLLCVLLRDELRRFEETDLENHRCVVMHRDLLSHWLLFFPPESDEIRMNRSLLGHLRKLEEFKFVRQAQDDPMSWEVRRLLKARLPIEELERLRQRMLDAASTRMDSPPSSV